MSGQDDGFSEVNWANGPSSPHLNKFGWIEKASIVAARRDLDFLIPYIHLWHSTAKCLRGDPRDVTPDYVRAGVKRLKKTLAQVRRLHERAGFVARPIFGSMYSFFGSWPAGWPTGFTDDHMKGLEQLSRKIDNELLSLGIAPSAVGIAPSAVGRASPETEADRSASKTDEPDGSPVAEAESTPPRHVAASLIFKGDGETIVIDGEEVKPKRHQYEAFKRLAERPVARGRRP